MLFKKDIAMSFLEKRNQEKSILDEQIIQSHDRFDIKIDLVTEGTIVPRAEIWIFPKGSDTPSIKVNACFIFLHWRVIKSNTPIAKDEQILMFDALYKLFSGSNRNSREQNLLESIY